MLNPAPCQPLTVDLAGGPVQFVQARPLSTNALPVPTLNIDEENKKRARILTIASEAGLPKVFLLFYAQLFHLFLLIISLLFCSLFGRFILIAQLRMFLLYQILKNA